MLVVKVELHSANTGKVTELGRMLVSNVGGTHELGDYSVKLGRKGAKSDLEVYKKPQRQGEVRGHRRLDLPIWTLVVRALASVGFSARRKDESDVSQDHV